MNAKATSFRVSCWIVLVCCMTAATNAQPQPGLLQGPDVDDDRAPSLVERTMSGAMVVPQGDPAIAAIERLDVSADIKARARELRQERIDRLTMSLVDEIDLLREITDHIAKGERDMAATKQRSMRKRIEPDLPRSPLLNDVAALLDPDDADQLRAMVDEYWDARIDRAAGQDATRQERKQAQDRLSEETFFVEVRQAYEQGLAHYRRAMDSIYEAVDPTPEQREAIRSIVIEHIKATRLEATPEQRRAAMRRIYDHLDESRRGKFFDYAMLIALPGNG